MAGGDVITKGASKRSKKTPKSSTRAGGDVITKGPNKKNNSARQSKSTKSKARKK